MEKIFDFKILFEGIETKSQVMKAKLHKGTFGREVYNIFSQNGEFLFEAGVDEVKGFLASNHWVMQKTRYEINRTESDTFLVTLHQNDGTLVKFVAECFELQYAELLVTLLNEGRE
jgi:formylmethanofuran:tetrahydromethanopterin formyltransferase